MGRGDNPVYDTSESGYYVNLDINAAIFLKSDPDDLYDDYGTDYLDIIEPGDDPATGVLASTDEEAYDYYNFVAQESLLFTTIDDGTKYTNYNYMVFVWSEDDYLWLTEAFLTVKYEGQVIQTVPVPQFRDSRWGDFDGNPSSDTSNNAYIFGCLRNGPDGYHLDTSKQSFFDWDTVDDDWYYNFCSFDTCEAY